MITDAILTYELRAIGAGGGAFRIQRDTGYIEVTSGLDFDRGIKVMLCLSKSLTFYLPFPPF